MKLAIISLDSESTKMIEREAKLLFDYVDMLDIRKIEVDVDSNKMEVLYSGKPLEGYDCIYARGSFRYALLLRSLTAALKGMVYLPIDAEAFTIGHDKFLTLIELRKANITLPRTYVAAKTKTAKEILEKVHYPVIMKIPSGTHGKGVMFADSIASANSILDTLEVFKQPYIIQEYIETNATDIRAIVVGDKVVAAMKRKAQSAIDVRANIHMGGKGENIVLDEETVNTAIKSAKAVGCRICAVDILEGRKPNVIEVNLSPGLQGITAVTKINVAKYIAQFLYNESLKFRNIKNNAKAKEVIDGLDKKLLKKDIIHSIQIKNGKLRLTEEITRASDFKPEEEVLINVDKGKLKIERIIKEDD